MLRVYANAHCCHQVSAGRRVLWEGCNATSGFQFGQAWNSSQSTRIRPVPAAAGVSPLRTALRVAGRALNVAPWAATPLKTGAEVFPFRDEFLLLLGIAMIRGVRVRTPAASARVAHLLH